MYVLFLLNNDCEYILCTVHVILRNFCRQTVQNVFICEQVLVYILKESVFIFIDYLQ